MYGVPPGNVTQRQTRVAGGLGGETAHVIAEDHERDSAVQASEGRAALG